MKTTTPSDNTAPVGSAAHDWLALVRAAKAWADTHMDQWEKFKFETEYGSIYVTISMADPHPDSFPVIDGDTGRGSQR